MHTYKHAFSLLLLVSITTLLGSCIKQVKTITPASTPRYRLKTSQYTARSGSTSAAYVYTSSNKLNRIDFKYINSGSVYLDTLRFFYDSQDRLVKTEIRRSSFERRVYTYDSKGDLTLIQLYQNPNRFTPTEATYSLASQKAYRYDNTHHPIEATLTNFIYPTNAVYELRYTYLNGNVSQVSTTFPDRRITATTYEYDTRVNPLRNLFPVEGSLSYSDNEVSLGFSQNNRILPGQQLTYDDTGLLTSISQTYPDNVNLNNQTTYTYEIY
jgi:hypothetical protein